MTARLPLVLLAAVTAIVAVTYVHVFAGEPCGDDNSFHYAEIVRLAAAIGAGDWDWWNPAGNAGFASGYYYQVLPQAAPAALAALTGASPLAAFQLGIFLPLVLAPAAAYRAVRVLGGTPWQALGAAVALPFAIGATRWGHGADGTFVSGLYTQLWAFVALPLAIAHGARWLDDGARLPAALAWGLFVGLCHPFAGIALGVALAAGTPLAIARARGAAPVGRLALLGALLVVGSACAWLPVLVDFEGFGGFPHRVRDEVGPGFEALARAAVSGAILDHGRLPVLTALVAVAALLGRARWLAWIGAAAIAYALLLGVGPHLPKAGDDDLLPAVRFWGALQIVLALAAGGGAVAAAERAWRLRVAEPWGSMVRAGAATSVAIALVLVVDMGARAQHRRVRTADDFRHVARGDLAIVFDVLRARPPGRVQVRAGVGNHWAVQLSYVEAGQPAHLVMGGAALQSSPSYVYLWQLRNKDPERAAWVFDAPYVIGHTARKRELRGARVVVETPAYVLVELPAPGLVSPVTVAGTLPPGRAAARAAGVRWLWSAMPFEQRVLAHAGHGGAGPPPDGRALAVRRAGSTIAADVEVRGTTPTTFVIRESWHPRWRATIDGAPARLRRVTPDFLAIDVPPGRHTIAVAFERPAWTWLLWLLAPAVPVAAVRAARARARARAAARAAAA